MVVTMVVAIVTTIATTIVTIAVTTVVAAAKWRRRRRRNLNTASDQIKLGWVSTDTASYRRNSAVWVSVSSSAGRSTIAVASVAIPTIAVASVAVATVAWVAGWVNTPSTGTATLPASSVEL